jgi:hypothetical protein
MICRRCGSEIWRVDDDVYNDERGSPHCQTYPRDPVAPMIHAPVLDYSPTNGIELTQNQKDAILTAQAIKRIGHRIRTHDENTMLRLLEAYEAAEEALRRMNNGEASK